MEFREKEHYEDNPNDFMRQLVKLKNQGYVEDVDVKDINGNVDEKAVGKKFFLKSNETLNVSV